PARAAPVPDPPLSRSRTHRPYQQLWGVIQGAQYEDLRRQAARDLGTMQEDGWSFDGFGIGGALEKENLGTIVRGRGPPAGAGPRSEEHTSELQSRFDL